MSTTPEVKRTSDERLEQQLDQLMPRPISPWKRWLIGAALLAVVVGSGTLWTLGFIIPNPFQGGGWSSGMPVVVAEDGETASVRLIVPNFSNRDVVMTDVHLHAAGLGLVAATAQLPPEADPSDCHNVAGDAAEDSVCVVDVATARVLDEVLDPLPIVIPAQRDIELMLTFSVQECDAPVTQDWGTIEASFSFGEDEFPPFTPTHRLHDMLTHPVDKRRIDVHGPAAPTLQFNDDQHPLATLCELMAPTR